MAEDVVLQADRHSDTVLDLLQHLYQHRLCTDVTLVAEDRHFEVHMLVLAAYSPYFRSILESHQDQAGYGMQYINSISALALEVLLEFLYTGSLRLNQSSVWYVMVAAMKLQVGMAVDLCQKYHAGDMGFGIKQGDLEKAATISPHELDAFSPEGGSIKSELREPDRCDPDPYGVFNSGRKGNVSTRTKKKSHPKMSLKVGAQAQEQEPGHNSGEAASNSDNEPDGGLDKEWFPDAYVTLSDDAKGRRTSKRTKVVQKSTPTRQILNSSYKQKCRHKCDTCQMAFRHYSTLQLHRKVHGLPLSGSLVGRYLPLVSRCCARETGTKRVHSCLKCSKVFSFHSSCIRHHQLHHGANFACDTCKLCFPSRLRLTRHALKTHRARLPLRAKNLHGCHECNRVFAHKSNLRRHVSEAHAATPRKRGVGRPRKCETTASPRKRIRADHKHRADAVWYTCHLCLDRFHSKFIKKYKLHLVEAHDLTEEEVLEACQMNKHKEKNSPDRNSCSECATRCKTRKALLEHTRSAHPEVSFPCRSCNYTAKLRCQLEKHMIQRHGKDSWTRSCEMCDRTFNTKYHLIRHKFAIHGIGHPTLQEHKCEHEQCEYVTYSEHMLKQHQRRHSNEKPFTCEICQKSMKTAHAREAHIKKVHLDIRPWICDQCGAAYGEEHELKLHIGRHNQTKEFRCESCNYCTHLRGELRRHLYVVHNVKLDHKMQVYECSQCNYRTTHRNRFQDHERWHRDVRDIKCPHCDKKFTTMTSQRGHIKAVHKPKHLKCVYCSYASSLVSQMKTHVRVMHTHPNHKPFKCSYCDFHCATSGNCRKHIMQRHKGQEVKWVKVAEKAPAFTSGPLEPEGNTLGGSTLLLGLGT